jgi:hypothetical protein
VKQVTQSPQVCDDDDDGKNDEDNDDDDDVVVLYNNDDAQEVGAPDEQLEHVVHFF